MLDVAHHYLDWAPMSRDRVTRIRFGLVDTSGESTLSLTNGRAAERLNLA